MDSAGSPVSDSVLQQAVYTLNSRIRNRNLSAKEIVTCRDQVTGKQLQIDDIELSKQQELLRDRNHQPSAKCKAPRGASATNPSLTPGSLVYIKSDGNKFTARELYIVVSIVGNDAKVQKFHGRSFMSKKYTVPLNRLYAMTPNLTMPIPVEEYNDDDSSSDDDLLPLQEAFPPADGIEENATSDEDEFLPLQDNEQAVVLPPPTRVSSRERRPIDRYGEWRSDWEDDEEEDDEEM